MARDSFIFYRSFYEAIKELPKEEQADTYNAIMEYALNQKEIKLSGVSKAIFSLVKPQLDANYKKYENGKQKRSKIEAKQKQKRSKTRTNVNVNENVNDNVNVNENVNVNNNNAVSDSCEDGLPKNDSCEDGLVVGESCEDGLQSIINFYNENIGLITPYGLEVFNDYAKELDKDLIILAMKKAVEANIKTIKYIKGILNNWSNKGIKTVLQAQQEDDEFKNKTMPKEETQEEAIARKTKALEEAIKNANK